MPNGRSSACVTVLDGKAYVFGGRNSKKTYLNDLWEYDATTDTWTDLGETPLKARVNASMVAYDGKIYVGLGYAARSAYNDSSYLRDWWSYVPETKAWTRCANFPDVHTVACVSFVQGEEIYAIYGFGHHYSRDICIYSVANDRWRMLPDNSRRARMRFGGKSAMYEGVLYFGTGYCTDGSLRDWYSVDIRQDRWTSLASIPGKGREFAACTSMKDYIYLFGGRCFGGDMTGGEVMNSFMRYTPDADRWEWCGTMPNGRAENLIAFTLNGKAYWGLGEDENGKVINSLYCIE